MTDDEYKGVDYYIYQICEVLGFNVYLEKICKWLEPKLNKLHGPKIKN